MKKEYSSNDQSEFSKREQDLVAEGYRPAEGEDIRPGEYRTTMVTDSAKAPSAAVFTLEWVEFESGAH